MGLFSRDKKGKAKEPLPKLPDFPEMPKPHEAAPRKPLPEFPSYEPSIRDIKQEVRRQPPRAVPQRAPLQQRPTLARPAPRPAPRPMPTQPRQYGGGDKPLFVRIDDYKSALSALDALKTKIKEAEGVAANIDKLRRQEEQHLQKWQQELAALKSKLMTIDKSLFEV